MSRTPVSPDLIEKPVDSTVSNKVLQDHVYDAFVQLEFDTDKVVADLGGPDRVPDPSWGAAVARVLVSTWLDELREFKEACEPLAITPETGYALLRELVKTLPEGTVLPNGVHLTKHQPRPTMSDTMNGLNKEIDSFLAAIDSDPGDTVVNYVRALRDDNKRLYGALRTHGTHVLGCLGGSLNPINACTCGFRVAIAVDHPV